MKKIIRLSLMEIRNVKLTEIVLMIIIVDMNKREFWISHNDLSPCFISLRFTFSIIPIC